ncbi:MAG: hypothetical protein ABII79_06860 [bacterium]
MKAKIVREGMRKMRLTMVIAALTLLAAAAAIMYLAGCTETLEGVTFQNQKPVVEFVNIPLEGQRFSRNPVVYWFGSDPDGLIDYYRYHVVTVNRVGFTAPEDYIDTLNDSEWTIIDVDPAESDPHTENTIMLAADPNDPVNSFVSQWVFLQAFDMEGLGSDIVFRLFSRNDHPPESEMQRQAYRHYLPFVNGTSESIVAGVRLFWYGTDRIDYPEGDWPPLEYEWRMYGPYPDSLYTALIDSFVKPVLVTIDGFLYDYEDTVEHCDTTFGDSVTIACDTIAVADIVSGAVELPAWASITSKLYIDAPGFRDDTVNFNRLVDSSFDSTRNTTWVLTDSVTLYDVFRNHVPTETVEEHFVFWMRCRDDAFVADLVPAFDTFTVIEPRKERAIVVVDLSHGGGLSGTRAIHLDTCKAFWRKSINRWIDQGPTGVEYDDVFMGTTGIFRGLAPDYVNVLIVNDVPLKTLLQHKIMILYDDNITNTRFMSHSDNIYKAIDAGVNVWATWRAATFGSPGDGPNWHVNPGFDYMYYFGVIGTVYSGWFCLATACHPASTCNQMGLEPDRVEDFNGAYALDSINWPNLTIDTNLLKKRYLWSGWPCETGYRSEHPGLPEVDWSMRTTLTEPLYLYKSSYTESPGQPANHPRGGNYNMEGKPVGIRLPTSAFRTVHFNFTPLAIDSLQMQMVVNNVLDWLYEGYASPVADGMRYPDAPTKISTSDARERYWRRCDERALEKKLLMESEGLAKTAP